MNTKILTRLCLLAILTSGPVSASLIDGDEPRPSANGKATVAGQHKYTDKEISEMQEHARAHHLTFFRKAQSLGTLEALRMALKRDLRPCLNQEVKDL